MPASVTPSARLPLLLLSGLLALAAPAPAAAAPEPAPKVVPVPPLPGPAAAPALRRPTERLRALRAERDLTYQEVSANPEQEGLLRRILRWVLQWLSGFRSTKGGNITWNTLFYTVAVGLLVFAVLKFLQLDVTRMFGRSSKAQGLGYELGAENIHELNFPDAIAQAEATGNLRLATRLGYLHLLKQLTDQGLIDWQPDKTNQAYLRELAAARPALRSPFTEATRQFEYVWYGEFELPPPAYQQLRASQQQLGRELSTVNG